MNTLRPLLVRQKLLLLVLVILALLASRLFAATYTVNSTEDRPDSDPLDGVCSASVTGACTLRAAIMQANGAPDADLIIVPAGVYLITRVAYDDTALGGDLDITAPVTIQGAGSGATVIDGNSGLTNDRVFHVLSGADSVTLKGITVRHGNGSAAGTGFFGGGMYALNKNLTLVDLQVEENTALSGGGLYIVGRTGGTDALSNLTVQNNTATNIYGGGIAIEGAVINLTNVLLTGNSATGYGGGLGAHGSSLTMTDCPIHHNMAGFGGGVSSDEPSATRLVGCEIFANTASVTGGGLDNDHGNVRLVECYLHNNHASNGGGINSSGDLLLLRTLIDANSASATGGGLGLPDSDRIFRTISIDSSALSRNTAQFGGAIYYSQLNDPDTMHELDLRNSTVFGNQVSRDGAGIYAQGVARVFARSATIASNVLLRSTGLNPMRGGGIFLCDTAHVFAENTLVADNYFANAVIPDTHPDDIFTTTNAFFDLENGFNFIETTANVNFTGTTAHCIFNQDPMLDPAGLAYNGGATPTVAVLAGSPLIEAGNSSVAPPVDQRGFGRAGAPEIGAYEFNDLPPVAPLVKAVSHKAHGTAGDFDINLALTGTPTVECRSGGASGDHSVVFTFTNPLVSVGGAIVSAGVGAVNSSGIGADPRQFVVNLTGVLNAQEITVTLTNVNDSFGYFSPLTSLSVGFLLGDTSGNRAVNASDVSQTKSKSGQTVDASNFLADVTANGSINASDVSFVKSKSGTALP